MFWLGDPARARTGRRVAIVGTRRCTRYGRDLAHELGHDLAAAGVRVVSGLALGVDGAAHAGALAAGRGQAGPPVAVVGSGLDVVYPPAGTSAVGRGRRAGRADERGATGHADRSRGAFPVRNRVIAALAEVVVVVESADKGGSRHTVEAANDRGRTVMAVPGSVRSPVSSYTNGLLADGCQPVRDVTDVLVALGLSSATATVVPAGDLATAGADPRPSPVPEEAAVLEVLGWEPASLEQVVLPRRAQSGRGHSGAGPSRTRRVGGIEPWLVGAGDGAWTRSVTGIIAVE